MGPAPDAASPFVVRCSAGRVEGWATVRLPFEPRGWVREYRESLKRGLLGLGSTGGDSLLATYTSADAARCDVENVLLYNVGHSAFGRLALRRVALRRRCEVPPPTPDGLEGVGLHHHEYVLSPPTEPPAAPLGALVATVREMPLRLPVRVEQVWLDVQQAGLDVGSPAAREERLHLSLVLRRPTAARRPTLITASKVLVDGVMAAFSRHDGRDLATVAARLAARLGVPPGAVVEALLPTTAPLGERRLLWPYRAFVQWNPADEVLDGIDLMIEPGESWGLDAALTTSRTET